MHLQPLVSGIVLLYTFQESTGTDRPLGEASPPASTSPASLLHCGHRWIPGRLDGCTAKSAQIPIHIMAHPHSSLVAKVISCTGVQTHYYWVLRVIIADPCRRCTSTITGTCSWISFLALLALPLLYIPVVWSSTPAACVLALLLLRSTRGFALRAPCLDQSQF